MGRLEEALASLDGAVAIDPDYADAWSNRGLVLHALGRLDEALEAHDRVLAAQPDNPSARSNKALVLLLKGELKDGFALLESRFGQPGAPPPPAFPHPQWRGEALEGRTLLVHAEQGFGDTLQMLRYVPRLAQRGAKVLLGVQAPLVEIARTVAGAAQVLGEGETLPPFDLHCPMMSLPNAIGTDLASIPADVPYLHAPQAAKARWAGALGPTSRPRIGLAWSGRLTHANDLNRSLPAERLAPLLALDADFVSLQPEHRPADAAWLKADGRIRDLSDRLASFADTAAVIDQLDLVVSVDTSVAHLAGALARPLIVLLPHVPDYRWLLGRSDSPWYPTATLMRQPAAGDWESVMSALPDVVRARLARP